MRRSVPPTRRRVDMNDALLRPLIGLVLKRGVGLGGLPTAQQTEVFALAWAGLPDGGATERQINEQIGRASCRERVCYVV